MKEFENINKQRKRGGTVLQKKLQVYSNSMNNRVESCLLLNGKITKY